MKLYKFLLLLHFAVFSVINLKAQFVTVPDSNFRNWIRQNIDSTAISGGLLDTANDAVSGLQILEISNTMISNLEGIEYFSSVTEIRLNGISVDTLPALPEGLQRLTIRNNFKAFTFPAFPLSMTSIILENDNLDSLTSLPDSLLILDISSNQLNSLPSLPLTLTRLDCSNNLLLHLPVLPLSLKNLFCSNNPIIDFDSFNEGLQNLYCENTAHCLPFLPSTLKHIHYDHCIPNKPAGLIDNASVVCGINFTYSEIADTGSVCSDTLFSKCNHANTYLWNTGSTNSYIIHACRDTYNLTIVDSSNCFWHDVIDLRDTSLTVIVQTNDPCKPFNGCDLFADLTVNGGTPPYYYQWIQQNNAPLQIDTELFSKEDLFKACSVNANDEYDFACYITDANGITDSAFVQLKSYNAPPPLYSAIENPLCPGVMDGSWIVADAPGLPPVNTQFNDCAMAEGNYLYTQNWNTCTVDYRASLHYEFNDLQQLNAYSIDTPECGFCNGQILFTNEVIADDNSTRIIHRSVYDEEFNDVPANSLCPNTRYYISTYVEESSNLCDYSDTLFFLPADSFLIRMTACSPVYPGDANNDGYASHIDLLFIGLAYGDTSSARADGNINWLPLNTINWVTNFSNGINHKYADCNGDGIINSMDTIAISQNYSQTHNRNFPVPSNLNLPALKIILPDTVYSDSLYSVPVILGDSSNALNNIYGIAFSVAYDPALVENNIVSFTTNASWLGNNGSDLIYFSRNNPMGGICESAVTRIYHDDRSGFGEIGTLTFRTKKFYAPLLFSMSTMNIYAVTSSEQVLSISTGSDTAAVHPIDCYLSSTANSANSCTDFCGGWIQISATDSLTSLHYDWSLSDYNSTLCSPDLTDTNNLSGLPSGNYICVISDLIGCTDTLDISLITEQNSMVATANWQMEGCGACDGFIDLTIQDGAAPYTYDWSNSIFIGSNPDSAEDLTNICFSFNDFICTITDSIGCTTDFELSGPECDFNYEISTTDETCAGSNDGSIIITGNNWLTFCPFTYIYDSTSGTVDATGPVSIENLGAGSYSVILISPNTCDTVFAQETINDLPAPTVTLQTTLPYCGFCNGVATILIDSAASGTFTDFLWILSGNNTTTDTGLCAFTDYAYNFYDLNNCYYDGVVNLACDSAVVAGNNPNDKSLHNFQIIPNPNNGRFVVRCFNRQNTNLILNIVNNLGEIVYARVEEESENNSIDLNDMPSGIYLCRIISENNVEQIKFVKH